ncbi:I78 family peptidase inhibitor [Tabrizicola sp.]|uniref:I78 family peptidase inhibitor n=1 Tax=Tabrizicola sp. TaxID=2005166 RepID=UPI0026344436|nr:I78 family peptidase inhibitor [Tabrizicola sp.]MDM7932323.1 I78 family peptidase inhibitor [Tabrizicola sp.]
MRWLALAFVVGLAGCVSGPVVPDCRDRALQSLVGQPLAALEARVPRDSFKVDRPLPDGTVTLEDFPDRLRVTVDEADIILGLGCG